MRDEEDDDEESEEEAVLAAGISSTEGAESDISGLKI